MTERESVSTADPYSNYQYFNETDSDDDIFIINENLNAGDVASSPLMTNRISVADTWANDLDDVGNDKENPLESGLLLTILFKKFSNLLKNTKAENLYITSIFLKLASIWLTEENEATYFLHAFIFWELKKRSMGMLNRMLMIAEQVSSKTSFTDFEYMRFLIKKQLGFPDDQNYATIQGTEWSIDELESLFEQKESIIYGSIIFEEFIKEYIAIYRAKTYITSITEAYHSAHYDDVVLEQAIIKLRKPVELTN